MSWKGETTSGDRLTGVATALQFKNLEPSLALALTGYNKIWPLNISISIVYYFFFWQPGLGIQAKSDNEIVGQKIKRELSQLAYVCLLQQLSGPTTEADW